MYVCVRVYVCVCVLGVFKCAHERVFVFCACVFVAVCVRGGLRVYMCIISMCIW